MSRTAHHIFLSYSRKDNQAPVNAEGEGWVTAFERELKRRHRAWSGRELQVFYDQKAIDDGEDWRRRLGEGIRTSRLFLAFLSPNYITSVNCLWEWDEYVRREHSAAHGDDGVTPIFFVAPNDLHALHDQRIAAWLDDLNRRNHTPKLELHPWFERGPEVLKQLDAAERSEEVKKAGQDPADDPRSLAKRLAALVRHIAARLDRMALADLAPGNVARSHEHFVGRHRELSKIHTIMTTGGPQSGGHGMGGRGMIAAAFSPGGLGKTALARQYAHAYAEFYAAGGTWEVPCEGATVLGAVLLRLADDPRFLRLGAEIGRPLVLGDAQRHDYRLAAAAVFDYLRAVAHDRVAVLREALQINPERHSPEDSLQPIETPRALLILDNVDQPELLGAGQIGELPAEEWLELIVTTRLDPHQFGGGDRLFSHVEVHVLPDADALHLLRDFQPGHSFLNAAEESAARAIVRAFGGYTLAVELVAAYLGDRALQGYQPSQYLAKLGRQGILQVDHLADDPAVRGLIRHSTDIAQNHIATLIAWSLEHLSAPARAALQFASLLMPDDIPLKWLHTLTQSRHPDALADRDDEPPCWPSVWRELHGLRLLHPARQIDPDGRPLPETVRIHRLVASHVATANPEKDRTYQEIDRFFDVLTTHFELQIGQGDDDLLRAQHPWLRDHLNHLIAGHPFGHPLADHPPTPTLLSSAGVAADFEGEHGSLARALDATRRILEQEERLLAANPESTEAARDVAMILSRLAGYLARRGRSGDAEAALAHSRRSLEVRERLLAANPESAQAARDVSLSLERLGDFLARRGQSGDAEAAWGNYQRSLESLERVLATNPESDRAARDVSVSLIRLADLLAIRGQPGDPATALGHYQRSREVSERLLAANPESAQAARDVSISLERLGDSLTRRDQSRDAVVALGHYQRSLEIRERLLAANPESAQAARDVSVSLHKLADSLVSRGQSGDAEAALGHYRRSLEVDERLLAANPESAQAARDVSIGLNKLADFLASRGQYGDAEAAWGHYQRSLEILERLLAANPESAEAARDVLISLERLAGAMGERTGGEKTALSLQCRSLEIALRLRDNNPASFHFQRTTALAFFLTYQRAEAAGNPQIASESRAGCFSTLDALAVAGVELDPELRDLYNELKFFFRHPNRAEPVER